MSQIRSIRPYGRPIKNYPGIQQMQDPAMQMQKFAESRINGGLITIVDPADIPTNALQEALNCVVRYDKTIRRPGTIKFSVNGGQTQIANPDTQRVLAIRTFQLQDTTQYTLRFTPSTVNILGNSVWQPITPASPTYILPGTTAILPGGISGQIGDRFSTALVFNKFLFVNNGVNPIMALDLVENTYAPLVINNQDGQGLGTPGGVSTNFRYITGFFNRVVGAAIAGQNEVYIGWSGDGPTDNASLPGETFGYTQFDPAVDQTAGNAPLEDSPSDLSDPITGLFGFTNVMIVLREKSVWMATKQPIPTDPFNFFAFIPGIGCDCPYSAQIVDDGVAWLDQRKNTVYYFVPGQGIQPIGRPIENIIFQGLTSLTDIFSSYDPTNADYTICVPQSASRTVKTYTYNFRSQCWTRSEYDNISSLDDQDVQSGQLEIEDLVGSIEDLQGAIFQLVGSTELFSTRIYGRNDGGIMLDNVTAQQDNMTNNTTLDGEEFTTTFISKDFEIPVDDAYWAQIKLEYVETVGGSATLFYNKQTGAKSLQDSSWKVAKQFQPNALTVPDLITYTKQIKSRRLAWRLDIQAGGFAIVSYEVQYFPSGKQRPAGSL